MPTVNVSAPIGSEEAAATAMTQDRETSIQKRDAESRLKMNKLFTASTSFQNTGQLCLFYILYHKTLYHETIVFFYCLSSAYTGVTELIFQDHAFALLMVL